MKRSLAVSLVRLTAFLIAAGFDVRAGTWTDHFASPTLMTDWRGDLDAFQIIGMELEGQSASPLPPSPFAFVEVDADTTDCSITAWISVVAPNTRICTKGALVFRHADGKGYVFALHEATQTAEVYRFSNHEMLLKVPWKIDLKAWYNIRAELHGPSMTFFIGEKEVGSISDSDSPAGAVGLAVQDADEVLFDDFTITGPKVIGNVDDIQKPEVDSIEHAGDQVTLRFSISPPYDYFVQMSSSPGITHDWQTIGFYRAKLQSDDIVFVDTNANPGAVRFYRIEKVPCDCR